MMNRRLLHISMAALLALSVSARGNLHFNFFFQEAMNQHTLGHYDAAFDLLNHCEKINSDAPEVYFYKAMYLSELKNDTSAMKCLEKAALLAPGNDTYQERLAQYYINFNMYDKATDVYERLYAAHKDRTDVLNILTQLYGQRKEYDNMLKTISRTEQAEGSSEETTLSKVRVYELKGDKKAAYKALKKLADDHPSDVNYRVMMGNWLMQNSRQKEACQIFSDALKEEPQNAYAQSSLYDYYKTAGQNEQAHEMMENILMSSKTDAESRQTMLRQAIQESEQAGGDSIKMLQLFDRVLGANPKDAQTAEMKVAYMSLKKLPVEDIDSALVSLLNVAPDNKGARIQLIQNMWPSKKWDDIIAVSKPGLEYNPDEMVFYYFQGVAYFQKDEQDRALDTFRKGVSEITPESNKDIVSDFYAIMGDILHQKGLSAEAFAVYDSCLQYKPDNIECLNNYAYYLSEEHRNYQKAEQMSFKTIKAEPKNSTYLDTYAWILFLQDRYAEAKIYIDQAIACDTDSVQSGVILEHAGDIHSVNGEGKTALDYWNRAVKAGNESVTLKKKIKLKKYVKN
jgi:tetratricopeptide (TPR) repeat protein